jgi:cyclohexa-1,5-dienecarbonyl-CoA hydratase
MSSARVRVEITAGVGTLTLDRPPVNVLDRPMLDELRVTLLDLARRPDLRVLVLTGAGKAFCAGVDVADHTADRISDALPAFHAAIGALLAMDVPVIAAINGAALGGGCELAIACDIVLARSDARIGLPETRLGVFPPVAAALLPRMIGWQRAAECVLTGRTWTAEEAQDLGLVRRVVAPASFEAEVRAQAEHFAVLSGPVLRVAKRALRDGASAEAMHGVERAEALYLDTLMQLPDANEGIAAFLEHRPPVWSDAP